jgi:hypothetical protein
MTEPIVQPNAASQAATPAARPGLWTRIASVTFTDDGCRLEVRVGALLAIASVFLWQFLPGFVNGGTTVCAFGWLAGTILVVAGIPIQALQARSGRPGYPWKLGLALCALGGAMLWDLRFRDAPGAPLHLHQTAMMLSAPGLWIMLWWPVSRLRRSADDLSTV